MLEPLTKPLILTAFVETSCAAADATQAAAAAAADDAAAWKNVGTRADARAQLAKLTRTADQQIKNSPKH